MSYIEKVLLPDERVIYIATLHWIVYVRGLQFTIFGGLLGWFSHALLVTLFGEHIANEFSRPVAGVALIIVLIGTLFVLGAYIRQTSTELAITNHRLIAKYGFISRSTFEIMLNRITGANFDQSVTGRILGFGTILVHGAGGEISPIDEVSNPQQFHKVMVDVLEHAQLPAGRGTGL